MKKVTIVINEEHNSMYSWNALRLVRGMLDVNIEIRSVLSASPKCKMVRPLIYGKQTLK
jgi:hypothetical protein